ncbi:MAG: GNAT family N-acetyltransferase [Phycisphaeraceae bacterium]|nr:GNAT family N-acetyltransferase [Phycisphaeraceae bacterium]MBX3407469.1 GNAT family N-acetyltransferase [Phycisphaeraceae bacterium]
MIVEPVTLQGSRVLLRPLVAADGPALFAITPPTTFPYFLSWPREWTPAAFSAFIENHLANPKTRAFAVVDRVLGGVIGCTSYLDIDPPNRCVEIGATWYAPAHRGTHVNPECKLLLLGHAFENLGCVRVTLKCDARNAHSIGAISKLGAVREGTLRKHRIQSDGYVRDTVYFSIIAEEWPRVQEGLLARLAAAE